MRCAGWFVLLISFSVVLGAIEFEDNEFAEFEVADDQSAKQSQSKQDSASVNTQHAKTADSETFADFENEGVAEEAEEEFATNDDEEFETYDFKGDTGEKKPLEIKPLTFADIPNHFRSNWSSYQVEAIALFIILIYMLNYQYGRHRNQVIANNWFSQNLKYFEEQFALVGDDGADEPCEPTLIKETDYSFAVWCSGRVGVQGMLSQLKLIKRQDFIGMVYNRLRPKHDRVVHKIDMDKNEIDSVIFVLGNKKSVAKAVKDYADLSTYASERKGLERFGLPSSFALYAEIAETISAVLDPYVTQRLQKYEKYIDMIHISDQFCGLKLQEGETYTRLPDVTASMFFSFNVIESEESEEVSRVLMNLVFYLVEKLRRYRLSREGKSKAEKKRQSVEESYLKVTHQQRQEVAQARREEKARERRQRLLEEEDPEKQRRLQKQEDKRELRAKQPRMKQLRLK